MTDALEKLADLPKETIICCGHEYTVSNLEFAASVEPDNSTLLKKLNWAREQRKNEKFTVPSTIGEELEYNPFMRLQSTTIRKNLNFDKNSSKFEVMAKLRELKNNFQ